MTLLPISQPYLICTNVPCYHDATGRRYVQPLWHKDLFEHLRYIQHLTLACPSTYCAAPGDLVPLDSRITFLELAQLGGWRAAVRNMPQLAIGLWYAVDRCAVVHVGLTSALAWFVVPLARLRGRFCVVVVESSGWRNTEPRPPFRRRLKAHLWERLHRFALCWSNVAIFTHEGYRRDLVVGEHTGAFVIPASFIDQADILSDAEAALAWRRKRLAAADGLRLAFVGRLETQKGVLVLLEAMRDISRSGLPVCLDVVGSGPLAEACRALAATIRPPAHAALIGTVTYGPEFFRLLRTYDAVVVPSASDEQPRIVFDAYSQAVPVLATNTDGLRSWVHDGRTGVIATSNDAKGLFNLLTSVFENRAQLEQMGKAGLEVARQWTHQQMHRTRWELLVRALGE